MQAHACQCDHTSRHSCRQGGARSEPSIVHPQDAMLMSADDLHNDLAD